jgi:tripeptidyl-peptidase-2
VDSIDTEELAKYLSLNSDPEDEESQKLKKKMEETRDQLADALYQKGLALTEIESLKSRESIEVSTKDVFEENYKELIKWVDAKSAKYGTLTVLRERRCGRPGTALKVLNDLIQDESEKSKKKLYDLKIQLIEEIGWTHVSTYEKQWMHVRFPPTLPPF